MLVRSLDLVNFRNYAVARFDFVAGTTAIVGDNGQGKTNVAEALAYLATLDSFRAAPPDAMIRVGCESAIIRAEIVHDDGRELLIEAEINRYGRNRVLVNRQRLSRSRELLGVLRVTVFSPDDLAIVKGGPGERRRLMDDALVALAVKHDALRLEMDRILKQRNSLLKQLGGRLSADAEITLDVWDTKFAAAGDQLGRARATLIARLMPTVVEAYEQLAGVATPIELVYEPGWRRLACLPRWRPLARMTSGASPRRSDPIAMIWSSPSTDCRHELMPPRASSAALHLRFALGLIA